MSTPPPVIIPIGTSNPLDLGAGLPLFPALGTARAGISASSRSYKLFDTAILIVCTRLKISAYAGYGVGLVGPAIAFLSNNVTVARANTATEGQLTLTFANGLNMQAGAFAGAYVAGGLTLSLQVYLPRPWYKVWAWSWYNLFTVEKDFQIDLLDLMFTLINYLLSRRANAAAFTKDTQNRLKETQLGVSSFGLVGSTSGVTSNLTAAPEVTAPLNLANYVPKLREVNMALAKVDGEISFGPTVHYQYPVIFNFAGFTVTGGIDGADSATYENVQYRNGNQVTARGNTKFNLLQNPSRFTSNVRYETTVRLALSIHFSVKLAKFFEIGVNTPSLDLTFLLFRRPTFNGILQVENSVSTQVQGGCVLTPNMTLRFEGPNNPLEIQTGDLAKGTLTLAGFQSSSNATITLRIDPPVANFPSSVTLPAGSNSVIFPFTLQNQCLPTGNRNDPAETAPASPLSPIQTYRVRANLVQDSPPPCSDYQAETPLNITNRFLRCQGFGNTPPGVPPPWDPLASATVKADIDDPRAPTGGVLVLAVLWFPYAPNEQTQTVPVTFTLVDENRLPYARSDVEVIVTNDQRQFLTPSCTLNVTLLRQEQARTAPNASFAIHWNSKGRETGYSNRFYLLVNAGCQYGQNEFWLDVFNWS